MRNWQARWLSVCLLGCLLAGMATVMAACGQDNDAGGARDSGSVADVREDARAGGDGGDGGSDTGGDAGRNAGGAAPGSPVAMDLAPWLGELPANGLVRVEELAQAPDTEGYGATAQAGDWLLENGQVRFVVERDERYMSPCPFGGNIIDAAWRGEGPAVDVLEEICMLLNVHQTFKPETYAILADGSQGVGVLAVTGRTAIYDFLNIPTMVGGVVPSLASRLAIIPDGLFPLTITQYYILRAGDAHVQVVTALRNDGDAQVDLGISHLMVSRGDGAYFNPLNSLGGFGYGGGGGPGGFAAEHMPFIGFLTPQAHVIYAPEPDPDLQSELPIGGSYVTLAGVAASLLGRVDLLGALLAPAHALPTLPGLMHLGPGAVDHVAWRVFAGPRNLSHSLDRLYPLHGVATGEVTGQVLSGTGEPVEGAYVTAITGRPRALNQAVTDPEGRYAMRLPEGRYTLQARRAGAPAQDAPTVDVQAGARHSAPAIRLEEAMRLVVQVRTPQGSPTPARVSVLCEGPCPKKPSSREQDVTVPGIPADWAAIEWVGATGDHAFELPAGRYRIMVSRGMEWSVWPEDAMEGGGLVVQGAPGEEIAVNAEIARVLDTEGAMSGDFHVHAMASADSVVTNEKRVAGFMADGLDVVVSTDHDYIADYGPAVHSLGAQAEIASLVGLEITTSDLGHYNAFPVQHVPQARRGGALDWSAGEAFALTPAQMFAWIRDQPGESVVQINHPTNSFLAISDILRRQTYGDPVRMRLQAPAPDPDTGETGMWSDDFTAMELMNGFGMARFWGMARWWLTMIGRGQRVTGTAVSDTHNAFGDVVGALPRTYVQGLAPGGDTPENFDAQAFVAGVNAGRAIGTVGPYMTVEARNSRGEAIGLGGVLATSGERVEVSVRVQVPEWMRLARVDLLVNSPDVVRPMGVQDGQPIAAAYTQTVALGPEDLVEVARGSGVHRRYERTVRFDLAVTEDAWVVALVHGDAERSMYPMVLSRELRPFAFANPLYLDADGNGYDNPPLAQLAQTPPPGRRTRLTGIGAISAHPSLLERLEDLHDHDARALGRKLAHAGCQH